jgi:hypothetical protein
VRNLPIFHLDDGAKPIVVLNTSPKDGPVDFVFDDDGKAVVCLVGNQLIRRLKFDVVAIAPELSHEIRAPPDGLRPTGNVVENLVNDVVGDYVEEVLAINDVAHSPSDQIEIGLRALVDRVFWIAHFGLSMSSFVCRQVSINDADTTLRGVLAMSGL